jgi:hypothetical protein
MSLPPNWMRHGSSLASAPRSLAAATTAHRCTWPLTRKPSGLIGHAFPLTHISGARARSKTGGLPLTRDRNELDEPLLGSSLLLDWSGTRAQICFWAVQRHRLPTRFPLPSAAEPR